MKVLILFFCFLMLPACNELPFTNEEVQSLVEKNPDNTNEDEISKDEVTIIEEDMELTENAVIQNTRVILNMVTVKTFEHDLIIKADEFISNHSIIQNFEENKKAKKNENGKSGGGILIEANTAKGELQLILNGEKGGYVPGRKLSSSERSNLRGRNGRNGRNAIYREVCDTVTIFIFTVDTYCKDVCMASPKQGEYGGKGKTGLTGFNGKNGGNSGSFHLKAFHLSDFHLTEITNNPGTGSEGGKGSLGGDGGYAGKNGTDTKRLCKHKPSLPKKEKKGSKGKRGSNGKNGVKGKVCLEKLTKESEHLHTNSQITKQNNNHIKENIICY